MTVFDISHLGSCQGWHQKRGCLFVRCTLNNFLLLLFGPLLATDNSVVMRNSLCRTLLLFILLQHFKRFPSFWLAGWWQNRSFVQCLSFRNCHCLFVCIYDSFGVCKICHGCWITIARISQVPSHIWTWQVISSVFMWPSPDALYLTKWYFKLDASLFKEL